MSKNPDGQLEAGMQELDQKRAEGIERWVSEKLGGTVVASERMARWRPLWKVRYRTREGEERIALVRGDRPIASLFSLEHELRVMQALAANDVKVPRLLGWSDFPKAFVMDWVETGVDRDPGMIHTAIDHPTGMTDDRWQAMLAYMEGLARIHAIPIGEFRAIEGYLEPKTPEDVALHMIERQYRFAREHGLDDPIFAFLMSWLRRHVPQHRRKASFVTGDAGQFMSRGSEVAAYVDFEIAHIGDTHWDLACFRGRHPYEHMGDIPALYRHYAEASGTEVDLPVVGYHTASFLLFAAIAARAFMEPDARDSNWIEGVFEYASCARRALEAIAELEGVELDFDLHLPEPSVDALAESGLQKLLNDIERLPVSHAFAKWERDLLGAVPRFLLHQSRYGHWLNEESVREIGGVTGAAHAGLAEADAAIVAVIAQGDAARDAELLRILHRRILRFSMLTAGSDPTDRNPLFFQLEPILDRRA